MGTSSHAACSPAPALVFDCLAPLNISYKGRFYAGDQPFSIFENVRG